MKLRTYMYIYNYTIVACINLQCMCTQVQYMYMCMKEVGKVQGVEVRERGDREPGLWLDRIIVSSGDRWYHRAFAPYMV